jgi:siroheme synthase
MKFIFKEAKGENPCDYSKRNYSREKIGLGTINSMESRFEQKLSSPAIIVIGEVERLQEK